jgi:hypothetical protein
MGAAALPKAFLPDAEAPAEVAKKGREAEEACCSAPGMAAPFAPDLPVVSPPGAAEGLPGAGLKEALESRMESRAPAVEAALTGGCPEEGLAAKPVSPRIAAEAEDQT